ncbi:MULTISPECIES: transcription elongation factor GreA [Meiothermus]|uniref:Transcription elongation factor GreA n=2 Tax=Meiothermus hypogaeus TaxID=884155 RepID=A0A511R688_9DEIN|nr:MULTISPECIES: transcription elongation factor GreA [Meiothermus]RIH74999.1 Transcription elongation factor GreA [Meiothermus hypogaeus]GEM84767.1 transcription elongation factor GreA [Meiothermus hypogaeus NBRC 106114]GIW32778.1 MAG: transcription elongation factor GreA [Meiothermus sp.]GIW37005.1 MAG: transcription elongation factor GreA [Meiothermus sp.]
MSDKKPVYLTAEGKARLEQELAYLKTEKVQQIADEMGRAIAEGDLRENAGYDEARRAMWQNNSRIAELEDILSRVQIVESGNGIPTEVQIGVTVELETSTGQRMSVTMVGSHEADVFSGKISNESPLGQALMGKKVGDEVQVKSPKGSQTYVVVELVYA